MRIDLEYGPGMLTADLPDGHTDVFIPGETVPDPPPLPDPVAATREALLNPLGMKPLSASVGPDSRVVIVFPDRVKGGSHDTSHRKVTIPIVLEELGRAGVPDRNIRFICSNGLHRKNKPHEIRTILGAETYDRFSIINNVVNHDSEDWDNLVDLGHDEDNDHVIMNREVHDADVAVMIGHALGNPYGGYSGGYKHAATGIVHWKTIATNHIPRVMHAPDFTPVSSKSAMRRKFDSIGKHMEKSMGKEFFTIDAALDTYGRQMAVAAGRTSEVQEATWKVADKRTYIPWAKEKYDIMVFGMPQSFHYGNGHGTNPILMLQAISANVIRHKRVMNDNCVIIVSSLCNGYFHDEEFGGSYRALYDAYQRDFNYDLPDVERYAEWHCSNPEFVREYRFAYRFHPYHCFSMVSCGHIAHKHASRIYIVGAQHPGYARGMEMKPVETFEQALAHAVRYVGSSPRILALPKTFKTAGVHLMMENQS